MRDQNNIQDELNGMNSDLPSNPGANPYSVPEGYFDGLASSVLAKIRGRQEEIPASDEIAQLSPLLAGISRSLPYSVPEHYFQANIETLAAFTSPEDSLVLSFIDKEMPYEVPTGYFANFPEQVLEKINRVNGKVVPMSKPKWMRLAVAAALTGIVTISGIAYFNNNPGKTSGSQPVAAQLKKLSTDELNEFIKSTDISSPENQSSLISKTSKSENKKTFQDVSDKDLENFLDQVTIEDDGVDIN